MGYPADEKFLREGKWTSKGIEVWMNARDYELGTNSLYLFERFIHGKKTTYRLFGLIPLKKKWSDVEMPTFLQFFVAYCEIPIGERDEVNMGAWMSSPDLNAGGRPVYPRQVLDLLNQQAKPTTTTTTSTTISTPQQAKSANINIKVCASRPCVVMIRDFPNGFDQLARAQSFSLSAGKTTLSVAMSGDDSVEYMVVGVNDDKYTKIYSDTEVTVR
jgi:hypothetical protein